MNYNTRFKNARSIIIRTPYSFTVDKEDDRYLDARRVIINSDEEIKLKDKINIEIQNNLEKPFKTFYRANFIYPVSNEIQINEFEENDSSIFLLPLLELDKRLIILKSNFINAYIKSVNYPNDILGDFLYIVYRYMPFSFYSNLIRIIKENKKFVTIDKSKDGRFDILKYRIPANFKKDVRLIMNGKYIELSKLAKQKIILFGNRKKDDLIYQTLNNGNELRHLLAKELDVRIEDLPLNLREAPNIKKETWNYINRE